MAATDFIVAIELGSTEITGIAGKKNADGSIRILAYASERSSDCIKKGAIYNLDKTTQCLTSVIKELEEDAACPHPESIRRYRRVVCQKHTQYRIQATGRRHENLTGTD